MKKILLMINKITKYILLIFFLLLIITSMLLTFNGSLRRTVFLKAIDAHKIYQLQSIKKYVLTRDFSGASDRLNKYIKLSKKISSGKSSVFIGVYEATDFVASNASTQKDFNLLENVFMQLVEMDENLYKARIWLARSISDTDYNTALMHLEKAIEISPASEDAYREGIRIAQDKLDMELAQKFCDQYMKAQLGGYMTIAFYNYFASSNIRSMAVEFLTETKNPKYYSHSGLQLNSYNNYEFIPSAPINMNGVNLYFSFLPGIQVLIKEISIYSSGQIFLIPAKDFNVTSKSAYIDNNEEEDLSFFLVNGQDEILRLHYKNNFKSVDKIIITMKFNRMKLANNSLCVVD